MPTKSDAPKKPAARSRLKKLAQDFDSPIPVDEDVASSPAPVKPAAPRRKPEAEPVDAKLMAAVKAVLKDALRIRIEDGDFTNPNQRIVKIMFDGTCVARADFDVVARAEYGG